jgi:hypothetical protein
MGLKKIGIGVVAVLLIASVVYATALVGSRVGLFESSWHSSSLAGTTFDGTNYEIIESAGSIAMQDVLIIEVNATINTDSEGTLFSKLDYNSGHWIELLVDPAGTIRFDVSDGDLDINLETTETFNDGNRHTIIAGINQSDAIIVVDNAIKATTTTTHLNDFNSLVNASVGANTGYISAGDTSLFNYNGVIYDVSVYYK